MGIFDTLLGKDASKTANAAAADTYAKQQAAIDALKASGGQYSTDMTALAGRYDPYAAAGTSALDNLMNGRYTASPGLQAAIDNSLSANDRLMASRGMLGSGNNTENTNRIVSDYTLQDFYNWQNQQNQMVNTGLNATSGQVGTIGQGYGGKLATDQTAFGGQMQAAGTVGQGMVAGANAESSALGNLMNLGGYLAGAAIGKMPGTSTAPKIGTGFLNSSQPIKNPWSWAT